jgi:hypothetical protein
MRYTLSLEVKLIEMDEPPTMPDLPARPGADPLEGMAHAATRMLNTLAVPAGIPFRYPLPPGGLEMHKTVVVSAGSFAGAAGIMAQFDELIKQIELERA